MKLIDLLVQELPKLGGWPIGSFQCAQDDNSKVCFYTAGLINREHTPSTWSIPRGSEAEHQGHYSFYHGSRADDADTAIVTRKQYKAALFASQQPVWNGEGLPPVGCECELFDCDNWNPVIIKFVGDKYVVTERTDLGYEVVYCVAGRPERFRPVRTEAERKREEVIKQLARSLSANYSVSPGQVAQLYEDIAAGKITGVKMDI